MPSVACYNTDKQATQACIAQRTMTQSTAQTVSIADAMAQALERLRRADERQQQLTEQLLRETRELLALLDG